jgi:eukaryotic-like serine/threonine-protein kinase
MLMADLDALTISQLAVRLGLVTLDKVQDAWEELGLRGGEAEPFLRVMQRKGHLTPWQSAKLLKGDADGYFLGGYRILYKIASGSFGRVYRADDPSTGSIVAIKVLRRKWSEDKHNIELFEREGRVGMGMRHPNVVQILAVSRDQATGQYYIVMEFVEGPNLRDVLAIRKKLEPAEALRIIEEAAAALGYAYSSGLTHRDMKLTNILMTMQGTAKLVDFGLAAVSHFAARDDNVQVDRTVDYAGLEEANKVSSGDIRSDIYFLGTVLYELLTGRAPLSPTRDRKERMRRERFANVKPMSRDEVNGPPALFRLVENMMMFNPEQRFQTPSQLVEAIRDVRRELEGKPPVSSFASAGQAQVNNSVFVVEKDERLQDKFRESFKEMGFRVFLATDPARALDRFRQQPYDALIIDAGTTGYDGLLLFDKVLGEAKRDERFCAGILILSENQREWVDKVESRTGVSILVRPVNLKQLRAELMELLALGQKS